MVLMAMIACKKTAPTAPEVKPPPVINFFKATPDWIYYGQESTLTWSVTDSTSLTISAPGFSNSDATTWEGASVSPDETTVFTLTATNSYGSVTATCQVNVNGPKVEMTDGPTYHTGTIVYFTYTGTVKSVGDFTALNVIVTLKLYNSSGQLLCTRDSEAWDPRPAMKSMAPGVEVLWGIVFRETEYPGVSNAMDRNKLEYTVTWDIPASSANKRFLQVIR